MQHLNSIPFAMQRVAQRIVALAVCLSVVLGSGALEASAQAYKDVTIDRKFERQGSNVKRYVKDPANNASRQELYAGYFKDYFFPAMQQSNPDDLGDVGKLRFSLFKDYLWPADPSVQEQLTTQAFAYARGVISNHTQFHPTVGYNAVLVLGGLDAQYGNDGRNNRRPSRPLPEANSVLCNIVNAGVKGDLPLRLQAGALVGLERHARFVRGLPRESRGPTAKALIAAANQEKFPPGTDDEVKGWIKRLACRGLANFGITGPNGRFVNPILAVVGDKSLPVDARCAVAETLGDIKFEGAKGLDFSTVFAPLQQLAATVGEEDRKTAEDFKEMQIRRGARTSEAFLDPKRFFTEENVVKLQRRYFATRLQQLKTAFTAIKPLAGEQAGDVDKYVTAINDAFSITLNDQLIDLDVADALASLGDRINELTPAMVDDATAAVEEDSTTR